MLILLLVKLLVTEKEDNRPVITFINIVLFLNVLAGFIPFGSGSIFRWNVPYRSDMAMEKNI